MFPHYGYGPYRSLLGCGVELRLPAWRCQRERCHRDPSRCMQPHRYRSRADPKPDGRPAPTHLIQKTTSNFWSNWWYLPEIMAVSIEYSCIVQRVFKDYSESRDLKWCRITIGDGVRSIVILRSGDGALKLRGAASFDLMLLIDATTDLTKQIKIRCKEFNDQVRILMGSSMTYWWMSTVACTGCSSMPMLHLAWRHR